MIPRGEGGGRTGHDALPRHGPAAGRECRVSVRAVDGAGNVGPAGRSAKVRVSSKRPAPLPGKNARAVPQCRRPAAQSSRVRRSRSSTSWTRSTPSTAGSSPKPGRAISPPTTSGTPATKRIRLHAAKNEFVAFQVVILQPRPRRPGRARRSTARPPRSPAPSSAAIASSTRSSAPCPTRSCRWAVPRTGRRTRRREDLKACMPRFTSRTTLPRANTKAP